MAYFSSTFITAMISPLSPSTSATSSSMSMPSASSLAAERVTGIGQNKPSDNFISSQHPRQSASPMKPESGV